MRILKLYFLNEFLGNIHNINVDGIWINAEITFKKYRQIQQFFRSDC